MAPRCHRRGKRVEPESPSLTPTRATRRDGAAGPFGDGKWFRMLRDPDKSWGLVAILFHWLMAETIFGQFWLHWCYAGRAEPDRPLSLRAMAQEPGFPDPWARGPEDSLGGDIATSRFACRHALRREGLGARQSHHPLSGAAPLALDWLGSHLDIALAESQLVFGLFMVPSLPLAVPRGRSGRACMDFWPMPRSFSWAFMCWLR